MDKKSLSCFLFLSISLFSSSCSLMKKAVVFPTGKIIYDATFDQQIENDWEMFEKSLYGNIKLMEGFLSQDENNKDLLASLLKAYVAKAFAIDETALLEDLLNDKENSPHKTKALMSYTKALQYGLRYLMASGMDEDVISKNINSPDKLIEEIDSNLGNNLRDLETSLYIGQALGSLVNLQRTDMKIISYLPVAKSFFDWSCGKDKNLNYGACDIFYATYDAGRPRMLGGNPEKGRERFEESIKKWTDNWLVRASLVQFYAIPMLEEDIYREQKEFFKIKNLEFEKSKIWSGDKITVPEKNYLSVFNMIAIRRMEIITKFEKSIF